MKQMKTQHKILNLETMNLKFLAIMLVTVLLVGGSFVSCKSNSEKEADAAENLNDANQEMENVETEVMNDSIEKANDAEWQTFKEEALVAINNNEKQIISLKDAIQKPGNKFTESYKKSISDLEDKNKDLQSRIDNYENNKTDWQNFKTKFNNDLRNIGKEINNINTNK
ncbi:MAG: hypothetical protein DCF13_10385 [Flavobacteriaceae bacterium]|nr:MAG: hypothetical protein DCF13_10385 [Flavobacteriaceae bacterium]